jgi:hypothetical protein
LQKANIKKSELPLINVEKEILAKSAYDAAVTFKSKFVTTIDVLVAYLLLIEKERNCFLPNS